MEEKHYTSYKSYRHYKKSRDAAWDILIDDEIKMLPIPIMQICINREIPIKWYDGSLGEGLTQFIAGEPTILLSSKIKNHGRTRFTLAHELGHIILNHNEEFNKIEESQQLSEPEKRKEIAQLERDANIFAARIMAPACVLWGCNAKTPEQIMQLCDISYTAASYRAMRMEELVKRGKFLESEKENRLYEQFYAFVDEHRFGEEKEL